MRNAGAFLLILVLFVTATSGCSIRKKGNNLFPNTDLTADSAGDVPLDPDGYVPPDLLDDAGVDVLPDQTADQLDMVPSDTLPDNVQVDVSDTLQDNEVPDGTDIEPACEVASDCGIASGICKGFACVKGECIEGNLPKDATPEDDVDGDCQTPVCDGEGDFSLVASPLDFPENLNPCEKAYCDGVTPATDFLGTDVTCGTVGTDLYCDGAGNCVGCMYDNECTGDIKECSWPTCENGLCVTAFAPIDTPMTDDPTDCKDQFCNGAGGDYVAWDNTEVPADDFNECTIEQCVDGSQNPQMAGVGDPCTYNGGKLCNGNGGCVGCLSNMDCASGVCDTMTAQCAAPSCMDFVENGDETGADCGGLVCLARCPNMVGCDLDSDCISLHCVNNLCVQCAQASDCPATSNECELPACSSGTCGILFVAADMATPTQTPGDCKKTVCDGAGYAWPKNDDLDLPADDGNQCTEDKCASGVPENPVLSGTDCSQNGGTKCQTGLCVPAGCLDNVKNGSETDIDCGGPCAKCVNGKSCSVNNDCALNNCVGGVCQ